MANTEFEYRKSKLEHDQALGIIAALELIAKEIEVGFTGVIVMGVTCSVALIAALALVL